MEKTETVMLVETERTRIVVGIYYKKAAASLVVFVTEPIFDKLHQLSAYVQPLKLLVYPNTPYQRGWIATPPLRIVDRAVQAVSCGIVKMQCLDTVISQCEECHNAVRFLLSNPAIGLTHQFLSIAVGIIVKEIVKVGITTGKRQAMLPYLRCIGEHDTLFE